MISAPSLMDKRGLRKITVLWHLLRSFVQAFRLIRREKPNLVIGVGGYASGPVLLMASLMGKPTLTLEPNAVPGLTNRILRRFVDRVVVAYPELKDFFGAKKTKVFGVPVRKSILREAKAATPIPGKMTIFVFGGSQGAQTINSAVLHALPHLQDLKEHIHFIHQIGSGDTAETEKVYRENGFSAEVYSFIDNMGKFYGQSELVISRAGANSLAELVALAKPAVLIPYPFSAGGHQEKNALYLKRSGGVKMLLDYETSGEKMAEVLRSLVKSPELIKNMKWDLQKLWAAEASEKIVEECLGLVQHV